MKILWYNVGMSMKERLKSDIDITRNFVILFATAIIGMLGFTIANIDSLSRKQIILGSVALFSLCVALLIFVVAYLKNRNKLEEME